MKEKAANNIIDDNTRNRLFELKLWPELQLLEFEQQ